MADTKFCVFEDYKNNQWVLRLKTDNDRGKIGGHRLVELLGMSPYSHPISLVMGSFGFWRRDDNAFMKSGRNWEKPILDAVATPGYQVFTYEEYEGNCFAKEGAWWEGKFTGLMDAYDPTIKTIWEAKVWVRNLNASKKATYFQQLALYWKLWSDMHPGEEINASVAAFRAPPEGAPFNAGEISVEKLPQEYKDTIEQRMKEALAKYDELTTAKDGVIEVRSPINELTAKEINWLKERYKDWDITMVDENEF